MSRKLDKQKHGGGSEEDDADDDNFWQSDADDDDDETEPQQQQQLKRCKPYYVYLMACSVPTSVSAAKRNFTHIGMSREPIHKVVRHNEGRVNSGKRSTRTSAPHWRLEELIGPFDTRNQARRFQRRWFRNTKGVKLRLERGVELARVHNRVCYTPRAPLLEK